MSDTKNSSLQEVPVPCAPGAMEPPMPTNGDGNWIAELQRLAAEAAGNDDRPESQAARARYARGARSAVPRLLAALDASAATERDLRARLAQAEHPKRVAALYEVLAEARDLLGRRNLDGSLNVERQRVALLVAAVASFDEIDAALASTKETDR